MCTYVCGWRCAGFCFAFFAFLSLAASPLLRALLSVSSSWKLALHGAVLSWCTHQVRQPLPHQLTFFLLCSYFVQSMEKRPPEFILTSDASGQIMC
jgi:hypothetical protein